jgi:hypothetical protein
MDNLSLTLKNKHTMAWLGRSSRYRSIAITCLIFNHLTSKSRVGNGSATPTFPILFLLQKKKEKGSRKLP